ncbi:MAG: hypothetical protein J6B81_00255 [Spirochaetaceae bacterium]|nr:hypothetical protein [Spirochaetaceae bacterium]
MNKLFSLLVVAFIIFLFSCSNPQTSSLPEEDIKQNPDTLKLQFTNESESIEWAEEIEPSVTSDNKKKNSARFNSTRYSNAESASTLEPLELDEVYPAIPGLGILNLSDMNPSVISLADNFCTQLIKYSSQKTKANSQNLYNLMAKDRAFILTVFLYDNTTEQVFTDYLLAKGIKIGNFWQIPVRLYEKNGYLDIKLHCADTTSGWKVDQITYGVFIYE